MLLRPKKEPDGPERPSHFREDPNQRTDLNEAVLDYADEGQTVDEDYGFPPVPETPVPVYVVEAPPADRTLVDWTSGTVTVDTAVAAQIGGAANRQRRRVIVRNHDETNGVYIIRESTASNFTGYLLPAGQREVFEHNHQMWVRADVADVQISWFSEFDVDDLKELKHGK